MQIQDVMTKQVEAISPDSSLQVAAQMMRDLDVGAVPVCEDKKLIGIVTDRDITIRCSAQGLDPRDCSVSDAMTRDMTCCHPEDDVKAAADLMENKQIRRLPIVDAQMRLIGIVSLGDIATRQHDRRLAGEILEEVSQPNQPHA